MRGHSHFKEDRVNVTTGVVGMLRRLWPHFMQHKLMFFATMIGVLVTAAAGRLSVTIFGYAIDNGILKNDRGVIMAVAIGYFIIEGGRCFMMFFNGYLFSKVGNRILFDIRDQLLRHVMHLPISFFDKNPTGRIVTRVTNDVASLGEVFTQGLIEMFTAFVSLLAILFAMGAISLKLTFYTVAVAPPLVWIVMKISDRLMEALRESKAKIAAINAFVAENVSGMRVLQLYGRASHNRDLFHKLSADYKTQQLKTVKGYATLWPLVTFFNAFSVGMALYFGGRFVFSDAVTMGAMVAFILHVRAFVDPLNTIIEKYQVLQNSLSGAERVFTLFEEPVEMTPLMARADESRLRGEIEFESVGFQYGPDLPWALRDVSLRVKPGESVALVGRTGSGKSTLIALLQRFYDPSSGQILIDGLASVDVEKPRLRSRIGVVQQDTFLFRGTIAENISLNDPSITRERLERAAKIACLTDVIDRREGGLEARVEERGANLSVGERQLVAFARILAFDPDILILDEATANIDSRTESLIQEATRRVRQGRTSFIIAHRISTILDCDKIVVLDQGRVKEVGSHLELLDAGGLYAGLYRAQQKAPLTTPREEIKL